jgi:hypothetical protein
MKNIDIEAFGPPDISLSGLKIWISGRQDEDSTDFWDANWLLVTAHCSSVSCNVVTQGPIIHLSEVEHWISDLQKLQNNIHGETMLSCMEAVLEICVKLDTRGSGSLDVFIIPDQLNEKHEFTFSFDQSYLPSLIRELQIILNEYPIKGIRPQSSSEDLSSHDTPEGQSQVYEQQTITATSNDNEGFMGNTKILDAIITLNINGCFGDSLSIVVHLKEAFNPDIRSTIKCRETISQSEGSPNYGRNHEAVSFERFLSQDEADRLASAIPDFQVPAVPDFVLGCDGHTVTLEISRGFNSSSYEWWTSPPEGWEPLDRFAQTILKIADVPEALDRVLAGP